jgi:hypothetical protein
MNAEMEEKCRLRRMEELVSVIGEETFIRIAKAVGEARNKYPCFGVRHQEAFGVVKSEMLEWEAQAILIECGGNSGPQRAEKADREALDVIASLIRYLNKDYEARP